MAPVLQHDFVIVVADEQDADDLVRMTLALGAEGEKVKWSRNTIKAGVRVVLEGDGTKGQYLLIKSGGRSVAQALMQRLPPNPTHGGRSFMLVDDIYVEPAFRRVGLV